MNIVASRSYRPEGLARQEWEAIESVLYVERWGTHKDKDYHHRAYYISSVSTSPHQWQSLVREHWGIENRLHWPKDVVFGEDDYRLEEEKALLIPNPTCMALYSAELEHAQKTAPRTSLFC